MHRVNYERFLAMRYLSASRHKFLNTLTILAVLGVALGVAAFTTVVSVAGGFIDTFQDRVLGVNPHLVVTKYGTYFSEYDQVSDMIDGLDGVASTAPFIIREMLVTSTTSSARPGAMVKGVDTTAVQENEDLASMVVAGDLAELAYDGQLEDPLAAFGEGVVEDPEAYAASLAGVALGKILAERLDASVGDVLTLVSPLRGLGGLGVQAGSAGADYARVRVAAVVDSGFYDYDNRLIVMDFRAVQDLLGMGDVVMGVEVRLDDPMRTDQAREGIEGNLTTGRFRTLDWREINQNLFSSLKLQKIALTAAMSTVVVVASCVILCVLIMLVLEKRREIAILRSMGATARSVMGVFVLQGMVIGCIGTVLGLIGGVLACTLVGAVEFELAYEVYRVKSLPVDVQAVEFAAAAVGSLLICLLATIYPAFRAAKVMPVDALRYD